MAGFLISVVVNNNAKSLFGCLDSVCNQTLSDMDILLIDNGSTDNSSEIVSTYAYMDNRVRTISFSKSKTLEEIKSILEKEYGETVYCIVNGDEILPVDYCEKYCDLNYLKR